MRYYYLYKTTNNVNGKVYIGKRATNGNPFTERYKGSGVALNHAMKKYGEVNFTKEVLCLCPSDKYASLIESRYVTEAFVKETDNYNLIVGGTGGPGKRNKEVREKIKKAKQGFIPHQKTHEARIKKLKGSTLSDEHKQKISRTLKGRKFSDEHKKKLSDAAKRRFIQ